MKIRFQLIALTLALTACAPSGPSPTTPGSAPSPSPEASASSESPDSEASVTPDTPTESSPTAAPGTPTQNLNIKVPTGFFQAGSSVKLSLFSATDAQQLDINRAWQKDCYSFLEPEAEINASTQLSLPPGGDSSALFACQSRRNKEVKAVSRQDFELEASANLSSLSLQDLNLSGDYRVEVQGQPAQTCFPAQGQLDFTAGGSQLNLDGLSQATAFSVLPNNPTRPLFDSSCIHGQVTDIDGAPVSNALVAAATGAQHEAPFKGGVLTDAAGQYRLDLPYFSPFQNFPLQLVISKEGFHPQRKNTELTLNSSFSAETNRHDFKLGNSNTTIDTVLFKLQNDAAGVDPDYGISLTLKKRNPNAAVQVENLSFSTVREESYSAKELAEGIRLNNAELDFGEYYRLDLSAHLSGDSCRTGVSSYSDILELNEVELNTTNFSKFTQTESCTHEFPLNVTVTNQSGRGLIANVKVTWKKVNPLNGSLSETSYSNDTDGNGKLSSTPIILDDGPTKEVTVTVTKSGFDTQTVTHTLRKPNGDPSNTGITVKLSASVN